ncbi:transporter substrate-binding domain-containing protein [Desulfovibrio psychrotolerans]|uniref:Amino acid ABC transporter substrate-binding protein n=1 Tax=Desulfovibrio psychrotolerans TaxID=415242 RepID=A0A7J0BY49_9BACT|nr:transporter substrate-binding domain-containing protein [Desulfovibrio psychrotolerans]GFM37924.1 amino acid ABC transporter substrate-binding protein [Desulfovibrio psychrotolerans]
MKRLLAVLTVLVALGMSTAAFANKLIVAHDTNFKPFEYKEGDEYVGFDIDMWKEIAKRLNLEFTFQPMDFNGIIPGLQAGSIDAAVAGITIKPERQEVVDFSDGYYDSGLSLLVKADNTAVNGIEDLKDATIATKLATSSVDFAYTFAKKEKVKLFPNNDGMFMELLSGGADAVIFDMPVVMDFASKYEGQVKVVGPTYQGQAYGIGFPKGSKLVPDVNKALADMKADGTYEQMYIKWFGFAPAKN